MPLVEYSASESSESSKSEDTGTRSNSHQGVKRKRDTSPQSNLPPLPDTFHDLYASTSRVSKHDDPSLHGGRQRITPHIEGNWPTHIYIEWYPSIEQSSIIDNLLASIRDSPSSKASQVYSLLNSELGAELPLHISLSRPIVLLANQRQLLIDAFANEVEGCGLRPFEVNVTGVDWAPNYEKTRWFLVMRLDRAPQDGLNKLLQVANRAVQKFGQPVLYAESQSPGATYPQYLRAQKRPRGGPPKRASAASSKDYQSETRTLDYVDASASFHVSIGWTLTSPSDQLLNKDDHISCDLQAIKISINSVKIKIGNGITSISLAPKVDTSNRIIET